MNREEKQNLLHKLREARKRTKRVVGPATIETDHWRQYLAKYEAATKRVFERVKASGVTVDSFQDLYKQEVLDRPEVINVILDSLDSIDDPNILASLVGLLSVTKAPFDGGPLTRAFERDEDPHLRTVISNTIERVLPTGITDWVIRTVDNPEYVRSTGMLFVALAKMVPAEVALPILNRYVESNPIAVFMAWEYCGGEDELRILQEVSAISTGTKKNRADKAIKIIMRRLRQKNQNG